MIWPVSDYFLCKIARIAKAKKTYNKSIEFFHIKAKDFNLVKWSRSVSFYIAIILQICATKKVTIKPKITGNTEATTVHFVLLVSL